MTPSDNPEIKRDDTFTDRIKKQLVPDSTKWHGDIKTMGNPIKLNEEPGFLSRVRTWFLYRNEEQNLTEEVNAWNKPHEFIYDEFERVSLSKINFLIEGKPAKLFLSYYDYRFLGINYKMYYLNITKNNDDNEINMSVNLRLPEQVVVLRYNHIKKGYDRRIATGVPLTDEMLIRLQKIIGFNNHSYILRNSEHLMRFVLNGDWFSDQCFPESTFIIKLKNKMMKLHREAEADRVNTIMDKTQETNKSSKPKINKRQLTEFQQELTEAIGKRRSAPDDSKGSKIKDVYESLRVVRRQNDFLIDFLNKGGQRDCLIHFNSAISFLNPSDAIDDGITKILVVGPTGTGKSNMINFLFNKIVLESESRLSSVSKDVYFRYGNIIDLQQREIIMIDTVGVCDEVLSDAIILKLIDDRLRDYNVKLDKIFICLQPIRWVKGIMDSVHSLLDLLKFSEHMSNFHFFFTNCRLSDPDKIRLKNDLQKQFVIFPKKQVINEGISTRFMKVGSIRKRGKTPVYIDDNNIHFVDIATKMNEQEISTLYQMFYEIILDKSVESYKPVSSCKIL